MEIRPGRVAVYIRWSTEDQGEGTTLEVQREGCRHYVLSQGWEFTEDLVFVDDGYSGGTLKRPAIARLRRRVQAGQVDCVVVFKLDRLSRSVLDTVNLVLDEWEGRCYVKSAREPIDTTTPAGKLFFYMLLSYAEWERTVIKERTFSGKVRRAREGRVPGRYPYGYRPADRPGQISPSPAEAAVVCRIFDRCDHGAGLLPIARELNREGVPSPGGRLWNRSTVAYILKNPLYKGEIAFLRVSRNQKRERDRSQPYYIRHKEFIRAAAAGVPPLVSPELWDRVQQRLARRQPAAIPPRALASPHLLTGLLRCRCGAALSAARPHGVAYYVCSAVRERGAEACAAAWVRQAVVDQAVMAAVMARYGAPELRAGALADLVRQEAAAAGPAAAELEDIRQRLRDLAAQVERVNQAFRTGALPPDLYRENRAEVDRRQADLLRRMHRLAEQLACPADPAAGLQSLAHAAATLDQWQALTRPVQKEILRCLLSRIRVWQRRGNRELEIDLAWRTGPAGSGRNPGVAE